jgi:tmRNA-binding protein
MRTDLSENITRVMSATVASNQRRMAELFLNKGQIQTFSSKHQTKREKLAQQNLESHARDMDQLMQEIEDIKCATLPNISLYLLKTVHLMGFSLGLNPKACTLPHTLVSGKVRIRKPTHSPPLD